MKEEEKNTFLQNISNVKAIRLLKILIGFSKESAPVNNAVLTVL